MQSVTSIESEEVDLLIMSHQFLPRGIHSELSRAAQSPSHLAFTTRQHARAGPRRARRQFHAKAGGCGGTDIAVRMPARLFAAGYFRQPRDAPAGLIGLQYHLFLASMGFVLLGG